MRAFLYLLLPVIGITGRQRYPNFQTFPTRQTFGTTPPTNGFGSTPVNVAFISDNQCACVKPVGSNKCIQYNTEYQASSFQEAVANFVDMRTMTPTRGKLPDCTQKKRICDCMDWHMNPSTETIRQRTENQSFPLNRRHGITGYPDRPMHQREDRTWDISSLVTHCEKIIDLEYPWAPHTEYGNYMGPWIDSQPPPFIRNKRQTGTSPYSSVYNVDCRKKGEPVTDGSSWCGLCDVCWQWGILGSSYFPQYINQMGCTNGTRCLSGYGTCQQRFRSVSVLRNSGTAFSPNWQEFTINVPIVCDCQVLQNTALSSMVTA